MPPMPKDQLLERLRPSLAAFVQNNIRGMQDPEKTWQYSDIRRMGLYVKGNQYLTYGPLGLGDGVDYRPLNQGNLSPVSKSAEQPFDYVLNFLKGDLRAFIAVLGSKSPNVQAQARDLNNPDQMKMKIVADRLAAYLRSHWQVDRLQPELVRKLGMVGTAFSYVRYNANKAKYGVTTLPKLERVQVPMSEPFFACPQCGAETPQGMASGGLDPTSALPVCQGCGRQMGPEDLVTPPMVPSVQANGQVDYENGAVELDLTDGMAVTIPFWVRDPRLKDAPWLLYEYEKDRGQLIAAYPEQLRGQANLDSLGGNDSSIASEMGRFTRELSTSNTGNVNLARRMNKWLFTNVWMPPTSYETLPNDQSGELRDAILAQYPGGLQQTYVAGKLVDIQEAPLARCWSACRPEPGESVMAEPYFKDYIQASDNVNDSLNSITEAVMRSIGLTILSPDVVDFDRLQNDAVMPGEILPGKIGAPSDMSKSYIKIPGADVNSALFNYIDWYIEKIREVSGIIPPIFGGGPAENTLGATNIKKNQALMKLNVVWNEICSFWSATYDNGAWWAAKCTGGNLYDSPSQAGDATLQQITGLEALQQGGIWYQCDESMPQTIGERRNWLQQMLTEAQTNPLAVQIFGLDSPANLARAQEMVGSSDWKVNGLAEYNKLYEIMNELAQTPMPPPQMDPMTGMQGPPMPAVAPDPLLFDPPFALKVVRDWLLSDHARDVEQMNPEGFQHVMAYGQAWMAMMQPPLGPPMDGGAPPPDGGGGPPMQAPPTGGSNG